MTDNHETPNRERDDDIAKLVRLAGRRGAVPVPTAERVKAAARSHWREELRRRSKRRYTWAGAAAAAALLIVAVTWQLVPLPGSPGPNAGYLVESLAGEAWVLESGAERPIHPGETLAPGSELWTADAGRVSIRLAGGHSVRLARATRLRLAGAQALALDNGSIYVDSGFEENVSTPVVIETSLGSIEEIGTQFEVRVDGDGVDVRLREGAVLVRRAGRVHEVQAGNCLTVDRTGAITRRTIPTYGPEWDWIVEVTPMMDLEGRTAREFLDWIARERGWRLAFSDAALARSADEIVLGGSVARLSLDQALDAVLPTARMRHRVADGVLIVSSAD